MQIPVQSLAISQDAAELVAGEELQLKVTVLPENASNRKLTWSTTNSEVATVTVNGLVHVLKGGSAVICATTGKKTVQCKISVNTIAVKSIKFDKNATELYVGDQDTLFYTIIPENATDREVVWSSSDTSIVMVYNGVLKAMKEGEASVSATTSDGNRNDVCKVSVKTKVTGIKVTPTKLDLGEGKSFRLMAQFLPEGGVYRDTTIIWSSSDNDVANVSDDGIVTATANSSGSCVITAGTSNGMKAICDVAVIIPEKTELLTDDLSYNGTANCYIVPSKGEWKFRGNVKGNSTESVGAPVTAEVLWESFGTSIKPVEGDIVSDVIYCDGYVSFTSGMDGNAVIAVKDKDGTILWSWHIWVCEDYDPKATQQVYYKGAGIMMDRNLGATSADENGESKALGLYYQWGRKDPFYTDNVRFTKPIPCPEYGKRTNINYTVSHPTTYLQLGNWYYDTESESDNVCWQPSKTKYDPCPSGWRIPDGGPTGVWATASGGIDSLPYESISSLGSGTIYYPMGGNCYYYFNGDYTYLVDYQEGPHTFGISCWSLTAKTPNKLIYSFWIGDNKAMSQGLRGHTMYYQSLVENYCACQVRCMAE